MGPADEVQVARPNHRFVWTRAAAYRAGMTTLEAPIVAVTVYPGQARITRRGVLTLTGGRHELALGGLPLDLDADSVRVSGRGEVTITGVEVTTTGRAESGPDHPAHELLAEQRRLAQRTLELADQRRVLTAETTLLDGVTAHAGRTFAKAVTREDVPVERLSRLSDHLGQRLSMALQRLRELTATEKAHEREVKRCARELARLTDGPPDRTTVLIEVLIEVEVAAADVPAGVGVQVEVSYLVSGAGWTPRYDARLVDETLDVSWFGMVEQRTGEDWPATELRLSTARPGVALSIPELDPWYLSELKPVARPAPSGPARGYGAAAPMAAQMDAAAGGAWMAMAESTPRAAVTTAVAEHTETASTYRVARPSPVPSDGSDHQVLIATLELPAVLDRVTAPVRGDEVYLRATVTNTSEHTLRAGRVSLFHGAEFVGSTTWETWAPGEEAELALGLDDRVRVQRDLVHRAIGKGRVGSSARRHEARYKITVANYGPRPAAVTVLDQVPVSLSTEITVRDTSLQPKPEEVSDLGEVTWRLMLDPGARRDLTLGFVVDVARNVELVGWRD